MSKYQKLSTFEMTSKNVVLQYPWKCPELSAENKEEVGVKSSKQYPYQYDTNTS
jgi:hypothetical protein